MTKKIDMCDLLPVVKIEGGVQESNLTDFEKAAISVIDSINTNLQTDEDFAIAEQTVKDCKVVEDRIAQAKQDALNSIDDISALFTVMDKLSDKFRRTRLDLNTKVKKEKEERKQEIIDRGKRSVYEAVLRSAVSHADFSYRQEIMEAVKGKRSLEKMQEAVDEIVSSMYDTIADTEETFNINIAAINKTEQEFPGLFHDKGTIALNSESEVTAIIESRVNDFKLKQIEKQKREEDAAEAKKRLAEAEQRKSESHKFDDFPVEEPASFEDFPDPIEPTKSILKISVVVYATEQEAQNFVGRLRASEIVKSAEIVC